MTEKGQKRPVMSLYIYEYILTGQAPGVSTRSTSEGRLMRTITNNYTDSQILNLGNGTDRGPYLVTQIGVAPTDQRAKTRMFVLRPDGRWVDFNAYVCQGKSEAMDEIVFASILKLMETFG